MCNNIDRREFEQLLDEDDEILDVEAICKCASCKHTSKPVCDEPCRSCYDSSKWVAFESCSLCKHLMVHYTDEPCKGCNDHSRWEGEDNEC